MKITKIALIGCGDHVLKRVLPSLKKINKLKLEFIIVRNVKKYKKKYINLNIKFYSYRKKINDDIKWVYIATPNTSHFELTNKYLEQNKNIICEKPLTNSYDKTKFLINKAKINNLKLHEVDMFKHHLQFKYLNKMIKSNFNKIINIDTKFIITHLEKSNNIYKKKLSGDSLYSLGYYPISLLISLLGEPKEIIYFQNKISDYQISLSGKVRFIYNNFLCNLSWKIGGKYKNYIKINTNKKSYLFNRIFSKDYDFNSNVVIQSFTNKNKKEIILGKDDQFVNMINKFIFSKNNPKYLITKKIIKYLEKINKN